MTESEREEILKDIKDGYIDDWDNLTIDELFKEIEKEHKEIQQYRELGTTTEIIDQQYELQTFQAVGTIEQFKAIIQWKSDIIEDFCKYDANSFEELIKNSEKHAISKFIKNLIDMLEELKTMHLDMADDKTGTLSEYDKNSHIHFAGCYSKSIKTVNQLAKEMGIFKMENTTWTLCEDILPTEYGDYLCLNKSGEVAIGFPIKKASEDGFYSERKTENGIEGLDDVIYWQPLPNKPYEKEIDLEIEYE